MFDTCSFKPTNDGFPPSSGGGGGAVDSVFGRTGVVIAVAGDYNSTQITNSSGVAGAFVTDALNTLNTTKASLNSAVTFGGIAGQRFEVFNDGSTQINHGTLTIGKAVGSTFTALNMYNQNSTSLQIVTTTDVSALNYLVNINTAGATTSNGTILVRNSLNEFVFRNISDYAVSKTLTSGNIIVGNGSNVATAVAMSGDATISNTGAVTLANTTVTPATYGSATQVPVFAVDSKGRITGVTNTAITGFVPTTLTSGNIIVGNGSNVATAVAMSGDATISNTGAVTLANTTVTPATYGSATQVPVFAVDSKGRITSVTNTTISASAYNYLAITLSVPTTSYNKAALGGANYLFISTNDATTRTITIDSTGFAANDFLVLSFNEASPGLITLIIGTTARTFTSNRGNTIFAVYNGTEWSLQSMGNSYNTGATFLNSLSLGLGADAGTQNDSLVIGNNTAGGFSSVNIGHNQDTASANTAIHIGNDIVASGNTGVRIGEGSTGTGNNCTTVGWQITTGANTGVVAIGQSITATSTDAVIIGRGAGSGSTDSVVIGALASAPAASTTNTVIGYSASVTNGANVSIGRGAIAAGTSVTIGSSASSGATSVVIGASAASSGSNTIAIGSGVSTSTNTGVVAIGQGITTTNVDAVVIGRAASVSGTSSLAIGSNASSGGTNSITIGATSSGTGADSIRIGQGILAGTAFNLIAIGQGISSTTNDSIIIGKSSVAGTSTNSIIMGNSFGSIATGSAFSIAIGDSAVINASADRSISIGASAVVGSTASGSIVIGAGSNNATNATLSIVLGRLGRSLLPRQFAKGAYSYARHYGAESRRIDTNTSTTDATNPSRHSDNTAWIGSTNASTLEMLLFAQTGEYLTAQNNELLHFMVMVSAKKEGATDSRVMILNGAAVATGGVASLVGSGLIGTSDFNNSAGAAALTATLGVTSNRITMTVDSTSGAATGTWQWTANIINITRTRTA